MAEIIDNYRNLIEEEYNQLGLIYNFYAIGMVLHRIQFVRETKTFQYFSVEANEQFKKLLSIQSLDNFKYEDIFPDNRENKFDWSTILGYAGEFYSTAFYYCYSELLQKWFRFLVICPCKGYTLVAIEDITSEKEGKASNRIHP
jgi:hypothetical protein